MYLTLKNAERGPDFGRCFFFLSIFTPPYPSNGIWLDEIDPLERVASL